MKGLDYEEAAIMLAIAALLQYCHRGFYRRGGLLHRADRLGVAGRRRDRRRA